MPTLEKKDKEIEAMEKIVKIFNDLNMAEKDRILYWIIQRFNMRYSKY